MKTTDKQQVILVDDHTLLRDGLKSLIGNSQNFTVSGVAGNGIELQHLLQGGTTADIIVLDINMPVMGGLETSAWLAEHYPEIKILVLTMYNNDIVFVRMLEHGARGFLQKDNTAAELLHALEEISEHGCYYPAGTSSKMAALLKNTNGMQRKLDKSTFAEAEIEFLQFASTDMTYKEIAGQMNKSSSFIDKYRQLLFEKAGVCSRVGLVVYAIKNGLVSV